MRIAHLPSSYFPDSVGGTEVYVQTLCRELQTHGHRSAVVWHTERPAPVNKGLAESGNAVEESVRLPAHKPRGRLDLYRNATGCEPPGFQAFLRDWQPDVVHFHAYTLGAGNDHAECCLRGGVPYVVTYHTPAESCARGTLLHWGTEPCDGRIDGRRCAACSLHAQGWPRSLAVFASLSPIGHWLLPDSPLTTRLALPSMLAESKKQWDKFFIGAREVIACAEFCRDVLLANGVPPDRVTVERQGLPGDDRRRALRLPLPTPAGRPLRIGYFGRMNPAKGPDLLPAAVQRLRANGLDVVGEWIGPVENDSRWADAMFAAGLPHVRYMGVKRGDELTQWIRNCDLIVIPSRGLETGPLTVLEAWDQATPVVGTDLGGLREFMVAAGLTECLFPADDADQLAAAVQRMLEWNGPAPVVSIPGITQRVERLIPIYRRAISDLPSGRVANSPVRVHV